GGAVSARLRCARGTCAGDRARVSMRRVVVRLSDSAPPALDLAGSLFADGSRRGTQLVSPTASDVGGGVAGVVADVNGTLAGGRATDCATANGYGLRLEPCPAQAKPAFGLDTRLAPFVQGPN